MDYPTAIERRLTRRARDLDRAKRDFAVDLTSFRMVLGTAAPIIGPEAAIERALNDEDACRATPLFRFCFGVIYSVPAVCARYREAARQQLAENRSYMGVWGLEPLNRLEEAPSTALSS